MNNETTKRVQPPVSNVDAIFDGGASGRLILRTEDRAVLFEVQSRRVLGEITAPKLKSVSWAPDGSKVRCLVSGQENVWFLFCRKIPFLHDTEIPLLFSLWNCFFFVSACQNSVR